MSFAEEQIDYIADQLLRGHPCERCGRRVPNPQHLLCDNCWLGAYDARDSDDLDIGDNWENFIQDTVI